MIPIPDIFIKIAAILLVITSAIAFHLWKVNSLESDVRDLEDRLTAVTVATGIQNAEIARLNDLSKEYNKLLEDAAKKNSSERKSSEALIRDIMGRNIPKDCPGAVNSLKEFFQGGATKWNAK